MKRKGLIQIFAMNPTSFKRFVRKVASTGELGDEYARRMVIFWIDDTFIKESTTINIHLNVNNVNHINQHTNIYNNAETIANSIDVAHSPRNFEETLGR